MLNSENLEILLKKSTIPKQPFDLENRITYN